MTNILDGVQLLGAFDPWLWMVVGLVGGFFLGAIPGLSGPNSVAILLPFSIYLSPLSALVLMAGVYAGSAFGASLPGILLNVPGNAEAAAAAQDGYPLTLQGKSQLAIGISRMSSVVGGTVSAVAAILLIGPAGDVSLRFGPRELFVLSVMGIVIVSGLVGRPMWKGIISGLLGLGLATIGHSPLTAESRFTMGFPDLYDGIPFVAAVVGLFAISQMLELSTSTLRPKAARPTAQRTSWRRTIPDAAEGARITLRNRRALGVSTGLGLVIGLIPGIGASVGNFLAYGLARRFSKKPERFGHGSPEGIIAPEACDNAVTCMTLVPTMCLGVPGSSTAAIMLAALALHGIEPGPQVMASQAPTIYAVLIAMLAAALLILPLGILCANTMAFVIRVPVKVLVPVVVVLCVVGAYATNQSMFDVWITVLFGILGYVMLRLGYPLVPLVIGLILGPLIESNLARSLALGKNSVGYFVDSPIAAALWVVLVAMIVIGFVVPALRARRRGVVAPVSPDGGDSAERNGDLGGEHDVLFK
jgi:putative tricarboxylic transport membrane protein